MNVECNEEGEVVGSREARIAADIVSLIEMKGVAEGASSLLGLSLEREKKDQVSDYVVEVLAGISRAQEISWRNMYLTNADLLDMNESPNNQVHTE